jgi:hypothetical protein
MVKHWWGRVKDLFQKHTPECVIILVVGYVIGRLL